MRLVAAQTPVVQRVSLHRDVRETRQGQPVLGLRLPPHVGKGGNPPRLGGGSKLEIILVVEFR